MSTSLPKVQPARYAPENALGPVVTCCIACGARDFAQISLLQDNPPVSLLQCRGCGLGSASRLPTAEFLHDFYRNHFYAMLPRRLGGGTGITFSQDARLARHVQHLAQPALAGVRHPALLDFGGGDGSVAVALARELLAGGATTVAITVVDYPGSLVRSDDPRIAIHYCSPVDSPMPSGFDLAIASAALEHVPDPVATLDRLLDTLRPGGIFYARTPCAIPLLKLARRLGIHWDFYYPAHLYDLGQAPWEFLADQRHNKLTLLRSAPSIVESDWRTQPLRTIAAHLLKSLWHLFGRRYTLVGGWEVAIERRQPA